VPRIRYAAQLEELAAALVLWRWLEQRDGKARNLPACACPCGRRIRAAKATLAEARPLRPLRGTVPTR
jgi:hypothetical protein